MLSQSRLQTPSAGSPWIKLCGLRDPATAVALAALRPQAVGLNFYRSSPRYVDRESARAISDTLSDDVMSVGVFVNASLKEMIETARVVNLGAIQLHGDELPTVIARLREVLPDLPIIRAWRVDESGLDSLAAHLEKCDVAPDAILVDARLPGTYGGTGHTAPWDVLRDYSAQWPPLILAGGLHSGNVAAAISDVCPFGVDAASGIESAPGVKDSQRAAAFVTAARLARRDSRP